MEGLTFELGLQYARNFDQGKDMAGTIVQFDFGRGLSSPMTAWNSSQTVRA